MARTSRNTNRDKLTTRIYDAQGNFECRRPDDEAHAMKTRGDLEDYFEPSTGRWIGMQRLAAHSDSGVSPAAITLADMLANVGISRHRYADVTQGRIFHAQGKIAENGARPSWKYRGKLLGYGIAAVEAV